MALLQKEQDPLSIPGIGQQNWEFADLLAYSRNA